jgi:cobalamin transport system substrate-binding protein
VFSLSPNARRRVGRLTVLAVAAVVGLSGCANREQASTEKPTADSSFPVTLTPAQGDPVTITARPERIVSLSASNTEILYAVGAGRQVVAVDEQSDYPESAPKTDLSGLTPNVEAIADYNPDLVVISDDVDGLAKSLTNLGHPVLTVPAATTLDDVYAGIELVGKATGHADEATNLAQHTKADLEKIVEDTPKPKQRLTYYHELDTELYSATSTTFIGQIYGLFGLENIADPADTDKGGYPKLTAEHILASDPDLIFLADVQCCGQSAKTVGERPGWSTLTAVREGNVVELNDDLASRWGPRVVGLARDISKAVTKAGGAN